MPQQIQTGVSDKVIDSFMAVPDEKKREALSKMSEPTKQALLTGIKARKSAQPQTQTGITSQPQAAPTPPPSSSSNPMPPYQGGAAGFTPSNLGSAAVQGGKNVIQGTTGVLPTDEKGVQAKVGEGSPIEIVANIEKYLPKFAEESNEIHSEASAALTRFKKTKSPSDLAEGYTKVALSQIPMIGPWLNQQYNRAMSGDVGGAVTETGTTLAAAKLIKTLEEVGRGKVESIPEVMGDVKAAKAKTNNGVPKHVVVATSNIILDKVKTELFGEPGERTDTSFIKEQTRRKRGELDTLYNDIIAKDKAHATQRGESMAAFPKTDILWAVDQAKKTLRATNLHEGKELPGVSRFKSVLASRPDRLEFNDVKQLRSDVGATLERLDGTDKAVMSGVYKLLGQAMKARAEQVGAGSQLSRFEELTKTIAKHEGSTIKELKSKKTGLELFTELGKESNQGRLRLFEEEMGLPPNFFANMVTRFKPLTNLAKQVENTSLTGQKVNRMSAILRHPIASVIGATGGAAVGSAVGAIIQHPIVGTFLGVTPGVLKAADFMDRYDAAKRIRELGGPDNITGRPSSMTVPSSSGAPPPGGPQMGQGGGQPGLPPAPPPSTGGISPALQKLIPEARIPQVRLETDSTGIQWAIADDGVRVSVPKSIEATKLSEYVEKKLDEQREMQKGVKSKVASSEENVSKRMKAISKIQREQGVGYGRATIIYDSKITKATPEERGRTVSSRSGMTKDTPEARRAKAAARIASKRASGEYATFSSGGDVAGKAESLEAQARQLSGRVTAQSLRNLNIVDIEGAAKELDHTPTKMIYRGLQGLKKSQKWTDEIYRGYLEDYILKSIEQKAKEPTLMDKPKKIE